MEGCKEWSHQLASYIWMPLCRCCERFVWPQQAEHLQLPLSQLSPSYLKLPLSAKIQQRNMRSNMLIKWWDADGNFSEDEGVIISSYLCSLAAGEPSVVHKQVQCPRCCVRQHVQPHTGHGCQHTLHAVVEDVIHSVKHTHLRKHVIMVT